MPQTPLDTWTALLSDLSPSLIRKIEAHLDFSDLPDFYQFALMYLNNQCPDKEKTESVIDLLFEGKVLHKALATTQVTTQEEANILMQAAMTRNNMFDAGLLQYLLSGRLWPEEVPVAEIMRVLALIERTSDAQRLSVTLIKFAKHPDVRVVSKAAKLLGKWVDSFDWVDRFYQNNDARIRANLIQGLGMRKDLKPFLALIERASTDPSDRVSTMAMAILARYGHQRSKTFLHLRRRSKVEHVRDAAEFAFAALTAPFMEGGPTDDTAKAADDTAKAADETAKAADETAKAASANLEDKAPEATTTEAQLETESAVSS